MNAVLNRDELIGALKIISCAADKDKVSKVKTASFILLENNEVSSKAVIHLSDSQVNISDFIYNSNYLTEYVSKCTGDINVNICKDGKFMP